MFLSVLWEAVIDTLKLLPFLFLTYLVMEYIEHKTKESSKSLLGKAGRIGPLLGGLVGAVPQCGFSAMSASLYAGGMISLGTLAAAFLSTSDEMLPVMISNTVPISVMVKTLLFKIGAGTISGFAIDGVISLLKGSSRNTKNFEDLCKREHCGCDDEEEHGIILPALRHTVNVTWFIFLITLGAALAVEYMGTDRISAFLAGNQITGIFAAGLIGLIPNCASSVLITELYLKSLLTPAQFITGLLIGAGVGLLVLFRTNRGVKENLKILVLIYCTGIFWGFITAASGLRF